MYNVTVAPYSSEYISLPMRETIQSLSSQQVHEMGIIGEWTDSSPYRRCGAQQYCYNSRRFISCATDFRCIPFGQRPVAKSTVLALGAGCRQKDEPEKVRQEIPLI